MFAKPLLTLLLSAFVVAYAFAQKDFAANVNPFVGTNGTGHTFPGACAPFGMAQPSPDTKHWGWGYTSGYQYADTTIMGFSQTHLSGTGMGDLGDVLLMPFTGSMSRIGFGGCAFSSRYDKKTEQIFDGYTATQTVSFTSIKNPVLMKKIETVIDQTAELINSGIQFNPNAVQYTYTDLPSLKKDLIEKATADAKERAEKIVKTGAGNLGKLKNATMGGS